MQNKTTKKTKSIPQVITDADIKNATVVELTDNEVEETLKNNDLAFVIKQVIKAVYFIHPIQLGRSFQQSFTHSDNARAIIIGDCLKITQDNRKEYTLIPLSNVRCMEIEDVREKL